MSSNNLNGTEVLWPSTDTHFVYDGNQIVLQLDDDGGVTNRNLWGPAVDQILADEQVQPDGSSETLWPLTDHLNTVRDLAVYNPDTSQTTIANHIIYDAFGRVTSQTDPTVATLFGFTARPFDADTGLQNNLNRWYDAEVGRWLSEDPIGFEGGDANLYRYVGNLPVTHVDPLGLDREVRFSLGHQYILVDAWSEQGEHIGYYQLHFSAWNGYTTERVYVYYESTIFLDQKVRVYHSTSAQDKALLEKWKELEDSRHGAEGWWRVQYIPLLNDCIQVTTRYDDYGGLTTARVIWPMMDILKWSKQNGWETYTVPYEAGTAERFPPPTFGPPH